LPFSTKLLNFLRLLRKSFTRKEILDLIKGDRTLKKTIYLIRHGETQQNADKIIQGKTETELSPKGRHQADQIGRYIKCYTGVKIIYSSSAHRAMQTAAHIANGISTMRATEMYSVPEFCEVDHGLFEEKTDKEIKKSYPTLHHRWKIYPLTIQFPNGEHMTNDFQKRVITTWEKRIVAAKYDEIVLVAHGAVNRIILMHAMNAVDFNSLTQENACLNVISILDNGQQIVRLMNSTNHLFDP
jgi:phosphoserine phosphatase